jgi:hypothetical protein
VGLLDRCFDFVSLADLLGRGVLGRAWRNTEAGSSSWDDKQEGQRQKQVPLRGMTSKKGKSDKQERQMQFGAIWGIKKDGEEP